MRSKFNSKLKLLNIHTHRPNQANAIFNLETATQQTKYCYSLGLHPWYLDANWESLLQEMKTKSDDPNLFAIGECGFDLLKGPKEAIQIAAFEAQLHWAKELGIPIIMHQVKGLHVLQQSLKHFNDPPAIVWHGFMGKSSTFQSLMNFPIYFSFGAAICKDHKQTIASLKVLPLERIFFETDDSELTIEQVFSKASLILRLPVEKLARQVIENWNQISKRKIHE